MASLESSTTQQKRQREQETQNLENKKPKAYNHILSLLDDDEDEPSHDISSLISSLQQEIEENPSTVRSEDTSSPTTSSALYEEDKERVMRHLLEASDDELGIPTSTRFDVSEVSEFEGTRFVSCDGLWELEDEAANYYTLLQSELFM